MLTFFWSHVLGNAAMSFFALLLVTNFVKPKQWGKGWRLSQLTCRVAGTPVDKLTDISTCKLRYLLLIRVWYVIYRGARMNLQAVWECGALCDCDISPHVTEMVKTSHDPIQPPKTLLWVQNKSPLLSAAPLPIHTLSYCLCTLFNCSSSDLLCERLWSRQPMWIKMSHPLSAQTIQLQVLFRRTGRNANSW